MLALTTPHAPPPVGEAMTPAQLYLGLRGRVNRRVFWLHGVLAMFVLALVLTALAEIAGYPPDWAERAANVVILWPALAISAKRWHDRERSAWWVLLALVPIVGQLWALIDNGFVPGTAGPNRFGPEPGAGRGAGLS